MDEEVLIGDNGSLDSHDHDGSILINSVIKENEDSINVDFLENLDDIRNNRLTFSRFANDFSYKGNVVK